MFDHLVYLTTTTTTSTKKSKINRTLTTMSTIKPTRERKIDWEKKERERENQRVNDFPRENLGYNLIWKSVFFFFLTLIKQKTTTTRP